MQRVAQPHADKRVAGAKGDQLGSNGAVEQNTGNFSLDNGAKLVRDRVGERLRRLTHYAQRVRRAGCAQAPLRLPQRPASPRR